MKEGRKEGTGMDRVVGWRETEKPLREQRKNEWEEQEGKSANRCIC